MIVLIILILIFFIFYDIKENINIEGLNDYRFKIEYLKCLKTYNDCKRCSEWEKRIRDPTFIELSRDKFCKINNNNECKLIECIKQNGCQKCKELIKLLEGEKIKEIYNVMCNNKLNNTKIEKFESDKILSQEELEKRYQKYLEYKKRLHEMRTIELDYKYCLKNQGCTEHCKQYRNMLPKDKYYKIKHQICPKSKFQDSTKEEDYFKSRQIKLNY